MNVKHTPGYLNVLFIITLVVITISACISSQNRTQGADFEKKISVQNTSIAYLSTQIAEQEQTNISQWEAIAYLYTQMPYALELITPIPPGIKITPTPYAHSDQKTMPTFIPTPTTFNNIEYPPDTRTGIKEIDLVIDVIMEKDIEARLNLVHLTTATCTTISGLGGPPKCEPGETEGTIVDAFPISTGDGYFVRPENIKSVFDFSVRGLLAVYIVPESAYHTDYWPAGEYGIVFISDDIHPSVITVLIENGFIVRLEFNLGWPPFSLIWGKSDEFILSPIR